MIAPSDEDYKQTKLIKSGEQQLTSPFKELADWIMTAHQGVTILNIYYDRIESNQPRLNVICENEGEDRKFRDSFGNHDKFRQAEIAAKFRSILADQQIDKFDTDQLFVTFTAFEPVARSEANWSITKAQIEDLKRELNNPMIWEIYPEWARVTFFVYTDRQLRESETSGLRILCADAYSRILHQYDEFGYFQKRPISVSFDSKENFDTNYRGNWFYYTRR